MFINGDARPLLSIRFGFLYDVYHGGNGSLSTELQILRASGSSRGRDVARVLSGRLNHPEPEWGD